MLAKRSRDKVEQESILKDALQVSSVVTCHVQCISSRLAASLSVGWVSRHLVDCHLLTNIVLFFICCLINCSFEQAL